MAHCGRREHLRRRAGLSFFLQLDVHRAPSCLSILLVKTFVKTCRCFNQICLVCAPREAFVFPFMSFSLYVLGPFLSATPPPLRYVRVRAPQGRGVREASRGKIPRGAMPGVPL